jgi:hypothetical protein
MAHREGCRESLGAYLVYGVLDTDYEHDGFVYYAQQTAAAEVWDPLLSN